MNNIERTKIKDTTFALAEKFPTLWQEIQDIQREEEELAEKRTIERAKAILANRLMELEHTGLFFQGTVEGLGLEWVCIALTEAGFDLEQLSIEFMY
jgi:hypothetical protein